MPSTPAWSAPGGSYFNAQRAHSGYFRTISWIFAGSTRSGWPIGHRRRFPIPRGKDGEGQHTGHLQIASASILIEHRRAQVQQRRQRDPDLPMRKQSGDSECARQPHIRRQAPEPQNVRHQSCGNQKSAKGQGHMAILPMLPLNRTTLLKPDPEDHTTNLTPIPHGHVTPPDVRGRTAPAPSVLRYRRQAIAASSCLSATSVSRSASARWPQKS